jgi:hypothetical protein
MAEKRWREQMVKKMAEKMRGKICTSFKLKYIGLAGNKTLHDR